MSKNRRLQQVILLIFILVSVIDICAILLGDSLWQTLSKPLIIPALIAYYLIGTSSVNKWYVIALIFSFAGDVLLLDKSNLFLMGIAAFLITQLLYISIFSKGLRGSSFINKLKALLPFLVYFIVLITVLKPGLQDFFIPVLVYGLAISLFGFVALLNYLIKKDMVSLRLLTGALLFIVSDSLIALNKFYQERSIYPVIIMITYIAAQYLIATYMLKSESNTGSKED
ncbi:lysoplasmalogenase [Lutimonas vermicola]|uniref:Lysoplasmalogenase n=1 Tax=Lutimonas vermicola TaxID=414288 RepID=A0ABU9KVV4_9FLAO